MLHVSALVHDDVMDSSDLRRGRPAAHRQFEALHANAGWLGDSAAFGKAGAILLGDLLVMWSAQMLHAAGLDQTALERALPIVEAMRTEVTCGQYLDIVAQAHPLRQTAPAIGSVRPSIELALDEASRVVEYKAARYTVQRPGPDRCRAGRRRRRAVLRARRVRVAAGPGLPVPRRPARGVRRPAADRQAEPGTTCARASARC